LDVDDDGAGVQRDYGAAGVRVGRLDAPDAAVSARIPRFSFLANPAYFEREWD
jgi:hypothetical protein